MSAHPHTPSPLVARAGVDPICDPVTALLTIGQFVVDADRPQVLGMLLDGRSRGRAVTVFDPAPHHDDVLDLAARLAGAAQPTDRRVILMSCRPGADADPGDIVRWTLLDDLLHGCGLELIEWFVLGRTVTVPRERADAASRWPAPPSNVPTAEP